MSKEILTHCPDCGANLQIVGKAHRCRTGKPITITPMVLPPLKPIPQRGRKRDQEEEDGKRPVVRKGERQGPSMGRRLKKAKVAELQAAADAVPSKRKSTAPSHPDCERCKQVRDQTRERVRKVRYKE